MHSASMLRMGWFAGAYLSKKSGSSDRVTVLDVGSYDVNGSYKELFEDSRFEYKGLDLESGPNVDIVVDTPYHWPMLGDESFDVVISGQAFEHIEFFWLTLSEMSRVLKRGGLLCIIAPRTIHRHRHPVDCYRFDTDGMVALAKYVNFTPLHASVDLAPPGASAIWYSAASGCADAMLVAGKPIDWQGMADPKKYVFKEHNLDELSTGFVENPSGNAASTDEHTQVITDFLKQTENLIERIDELPPETVLELYSMYNSMLQMAATRGNFISGDLLAQLQSREAKIKSRISN